jgi:hypothetical protein
MALLNGLSVLITVLGGLMMRTVPVDSPKAKYPPR